MLNYHESQVPKTQIARLCQIIILKSVSPNSSKRSKQDASTTYSSRSRVKKKKRKLQKNPTLKHPTLKKFTKERETFLQFSRAL